MQSSDRGSKRQAIVERVLAEPPGERLLILAPVVVDRKGEHRDVLEALQAQGFVRVRLNGEVMSMEDVPALDKKYKSTIEAVVDRLILKPGTRRGAARSAHRSRRAALKSAQAWCGSKTPKATVNSTPNTALVRSTGSPSLPSNRSLLLQQPSWSLPFL